VAVLRAALLCAVVGCYSPEAPDCVLACTSNSDCISGQSCTTDHLCAAGVTTCGEQATTDGSVPKGSDAGIAATVAIHIDGDGSVRTSDNNTCDSPNGSPTDCTFNITIGDAMTLTALPHLTKQFQMWTGMPCMGQTFTCHTTPDGSIALGAKFN
jgi:hypothetical protein